jgi:hypothetical protein
MFQLPDQGGQTDSFVLQNIGDKETDVTLVTTASDQISPGRNDTYFTTDIAIMNASTSRGGGVLRYHQQVPSAQTVETRFELDPNQSSVITDVVTTRISLPAPSLGWIEFVPDTGKRFAVSSRTYTTVVGSAQTFGTAVPSMPRSSAIKAGQTKVIGGLKDTTSATVSAATPGTFRTNLGVVETTGQSVTIRVSAFFADGRQLAAGSAKAVEEYVLGPNEFRQINGILAALLGSTTRESIYGNLDNVQIKVEVVSGNGAIVVYATLTDNGTGDTVLRVD